MRGVDARGRPGFHESQSRIPQLNNGLLLLSKADTRAGLSAYLECVGCAGGVFDFIRIYLLHYNALTQESVANPNPFFFIRDSKNV